MNTMMSRPTSYEVPLLYDSDVAIVTQPINIYPVSSWPQQPLMAMLHKEGEENKEKAIPLLFSSLAVLTQFPLAETVL